MSKGKTIDKMLNVVLRVASHLAVVFWVFGGEVFGLFTLYPQPPIRIAVLGLIGYVWTDPALDK